MEVCYEIRLPTVRERPIRTTTAPVPVPAFNRTNIVRVDCEPASISSTPPSEFLSILKKRIDNYYSNSSTDGKNN